MTCSAIGRIARAGIRVPDLGQRQAFDAAGTVGGAIQRGIVDDDDMTIGAEAHVELERIPAVGDGLLKRLDRVFRRMGGVAPVPDNGQRRQVEKRMDRLVAQKEYCSLVTIIMPSSGVPGIVRYFVSNRLSARIEKSRELAAGWNRQLKPTSTTVAASMSSYR